MGFFYLGIFDVFRYTEFDHYLEASLFFTLSKKSMTNDTEGTENLWSSEKKVFQRHGWLGFVMVVVFWNLNWMFRGLRTYWGFFRIWLGYCLTIDGLVFMRKGNWFLSCDLKAYGVMFLISMRGWWLFELFNLRMENWIYFGMEEFRNLEYFLFFLLSFSKVMAVGFWYWGNLREFFFGLGISGKGWKIF
jgi:hypothetical protein